VASIINDIISPCDSSDNSEYIGKQITSSEVLRAMGKLDGEAEGKLRYIGKSLMSG
jgi:hypothetical protein